MHPVGLASRLSLSLSLFLYLYRPSLFSRHPTLFGFPPGPVCPTARRPGWTVSKQALGHDVSCSPLFLETKQ